MSRFSLLRTKRQRWLGSLLLVLILLLVVIGPVWSLDVQSGEDIKVDADEVIDRAFYAAGDHVTLDGTVQGSAFIMGDEITINGTIEDDLYVAGNTVTLNGTVQGDVLAAGNIVNINGTVGEDVAVAARAIALNGEIGDDVRLAGQVMLLAVTRIADDVIAAGYSLEQKPGSVIGGNLTVAAGQVLLDGRVEQDVVGGLGGLEIKGTVGQDVNVFVGSPQSLKSPLWPAPIAVPKISPGLMLTDTARVEGALTYRSNAEAAISQQAQVGGEVSAEIIDPWEVARPHPGRILFRQLRRFLTLLLVGLLLLWVMPNWIRDLGTTIQTKPLSSLGWGLVVLIAVSVLAIALFLITLVLTTLLGITLPGLAVPVLGVGLLANLALLLLFLIFSQFVPPVALSFWGGQWLVRKSRPTIAAQRFVPLLVGLFIFVVLTAIPILGNFLSFLVVLLGLGALWLWGKAWLYPPTDEVAG